MRDQTDPLPQPIPDFAKDYSRAPGDVIVSPASLVVSALPAL
jgi:hypothetical protein